ncbi:MAG: hypothetical protein ACJA1A_000887 [Saprospiraceae bacterium]|jgi:hypothetical protein
MEYYVSIGIRLRLGSMDKDNSNLAKARSTRILELNSL